MKTLKIIFILLFVFSISNIIQAEELEGNWVAKVKENSIRLKLTIFTDEDSWGEWNSSGTFEKKDFSNLTFTKESKFELKREAGTIVFSGQFKGDKGYGDFTFNPDKSFKNFLEIKGFAKVSDRKMLSLTLHDVNKKYVNDLVSLEIPGLKTSKLISFTVHDISINYIKGLNKLFADISTSKIISFAVHDITVEYVKEIQNLGCKNISPSKIISFKVHDINKKYVKDLKSLVQDISESKIISFAVHNISVKYVREIQKTFPDISAVKGHFKMPHLCALQSVPP